MQLSQRSQATQRPLLARRMPLARRPLLLVRAQGPAAAGLVPLISKIGSSNGSGHTTVAVEPIKVVLPSDQVAKAGVMTPPGAFEAAATYGAAKAALPSWKILLMSCMAGAYISFGGFLGVTAMTMAGGLGITNPILIRLIMGLLFPVGLLMTVVMGAELFTGNTAVMTVAVLEKKADMKGLLRNWSLSYLGNFIGSLAMVAMVVGTGLLADSPVAAKMAVYKTSLPFGQALLRGLLCNWLVCSAVWMATASTSLPGKAIAAYLPITAFIMMGLEHSVANMFFIALGMAQGAEVSVSQFLLHNLLPVTLGNTIAGVLCMGSAYCLSYGALGRALSPATPKTA